MLEEAELRGLFPSRSSVAAAQVSGQDGCANPGAAAAVLPALGNLLGQDRVWDGTEAAPCSGEQEEARNLLQECQDTLIKAQRSSFFSLLLQ